MPQHSVSVDQSDVLVIGTGYLGSRVAALATGEDLTVHTTTRTSEKFPAFRAQGWSPVRFDWTKEPGPENELPVLSPSPRVLISVSYDRNSGVGRQESQVGGLERLLGLLPPDARLCYISTTGVYHQADGAWVDENSPAQPSREGGQAHLKAEQLLRERRRDGRWHVFRLSGIYGPGRVPRIADVRDGKPIASLETGFLNLIHVDDAAAA
ncbi:MAG: NAD-dependent epimerase/dehydratase family protein, partial [Planctomycetota bacterium]